MEARRKNRRTDRGSSSSVQYELYRGNPDMPPVVRHQTGQVGCVETAVISAVLYSLCALQWRILTATISGPSTPPHSPTHMLLNMLP